MDFGVIVGGLSEFFDGLGIVNTAFTTAERLGKLSKSQTVQAKKIGARLKKASKKELTRSSPPEERKAAQQAVKAALETLDEARKDTEALVQARRGRDAFLAYVNEHGGTQRREALDEDVRGLFDELLVIVADGAHDLAGTDSGLVPQALTDLLNDSETLLATLKTIKTTGTDTLKEVLAGNAAADKRHRELLKKLENKNKEARFNDHLPPRNVNHERPIRFGSPPSQAANFINRHKQNDLYRVLTRPGLADSDAQKEILKSINGDGTASSAVSTWVVLSGMRGVGKSQLAAAYARDCEKAEWPLVAWIDASSREQAVTGMVELAHAMGMKDEGSDGTPETLASRCVNQLNSGDGDRLIVFDNVEDIDDLTGLIPHGQGLRILVTTTTTPANSAGRVLAVDTFTRLQSVDFIRERTGINEADGADRLAEALGDLPVALAQAAATIKLNGYTILDDYLDILGKHRLEEVVDRTSGDAYPAPVHAALRMAYQSVLSLLEKKDRDSGEEGLPRVRAASVQLAALALLAPSGVPRHWLHRIGESEPIARNSLRELVAHSVCTPSENGRYVRIHSLQGRVLREDYNKHPEAFDNLDNLKNAVVDLLKGIDMDKADTDDAQRADALDMADQLRALAEQQQEQAHYSSQEARIDLSSIATILNKTMQCLTDIGRPQTVLTLEDAIDMFADALSPDEPDILAARGYLAFAYRQVGNFQRTVDIFDALLADRTRVLGPNHPDTLSTRGELADAYRQAGNISKAIDMYEVVLADRIRTLGPKHPDTLTARNNLAVAHQKAGNVSMAIDIYEALLPDMTHALGPKHPDTLTARNNLAYTHRRAEILQTAANMFKALLANRTRAIAVGRLDTLTVRSNPAAARKKAQQASSPQADGEAESPPPPES